MRSSPITARTLPGGSWRTLPPERDVEWTAAGVQRAARHFCSQRAWTLVCDRGDNALKPWGRRPGEEAHALRRAVHRAIHADRGHRGLCLQQGDRALYELTSQLPEGDRRSTGPRGGEGG